MEQKSTVLTTDVELDGEIHSATYFVEGDIIHVKFAEKMYMMPLGTSPA